MKGEAVVLCNSCGFQSDDPMSTLGLGSASTRTHPPRPPQPVKIRCFYRAVARWASLVYSFIKPGPRFFVGGCIEVVKYLAVKVTQISGNRSFLYYGLDSDIFDNLEQ